MPRELLILVGAVLWDLAWGEPPAPFHPVVWMGKVVAWLERHRGSNSPAQELVQGSILALVVPGLFGGGALLLLSLARPVGLRIALSLFLFKASFAWQALGAAGQGMVAALRSGDQAASRQALRHLCSRNPATLDSPDLAAATIESLAENLSDSVVAPVFYFVLLGVPGALIYRAVNTLDAMVGYRGRYEYFGKASARLDDLLNYLPARLTALLLWFAGAIRGARTGEGGRIWRRDRRQTESPNAGHPMAMMAGLLGVCLEKNGHYRLGDARGELDAGQIQAAWRLVNLAAFLTFLLAGLALGIEGR